MLYHVENSHVFLVNETFLIRFLNGLNNFWGFGFEICVRFDNNIGGPVVLDQVGDSVFFESSPGGEAGRLRALLAAAVTAIASEVPYTHALALFTLLVIDIFPISNR